MKEIPGVCISSFLYTMFLINCANFRGHFFKAGVTQNCILLIIFKDRFSAIKDTYSAIQVGYKALDLE